MLETKLHCRNLIKVKNNWAVPCVKNSGLENKKTHAGA